MSYCQLCQLFRAWLFSEELAEALKVYHANPYNADWTHDERLRLAHHQGNAELYKAAQAGCPLCKLLVQLHIEFLEEMNQYGQRRHRKNCSKLDLKGDRRLSISAPVSPQIGNGISHWMSTPAMMVNGRRDFI
jgi:hypothetical protein